MKTKQPTNRRAIAVGVGLAAAAAFANADPIASFDYTQEFEWIEDIVPASVNRIGATTGVSDVDGWTKLSWGTESNDFDEISSLVINPEPGDSTIPSNELVDENVTVSEDINVLPFADGPSVTHNNFVITGPALQSTEAQDYIVLTPNPGDGNPDQIQEVFFNIQFEETINSLSGDDCPSVETAEGCGDIFVLTGGLLGTPATVNTDEVAFLLDSFTRDEYRYDVFFREKGDSLFALTDGGPSDPAYPDACAAAGAPATCIGFVTPENESTTFQFEFAVLATEQVPAPASLFLLGGGLFSLAWLRRRRTAA